MSRFGKGAEWYRELRRPRELHGGEWRVSTAFGGMLTEAGQLAEKLVKGLRSSFSGTQGIRAHIHTVDGQYIGRVDIPKNAGVDRVTRILYEKGGNHMIITADRCGDGYDDDFEDGSP